MTSRGNLKQSSDQTKRLYTCHTNPVWAGMGICTTHILDFNKEI